ncbi:MAG: Fe2+-dependent dioxygenase [Alphaproteobacteria bacterium]
MILCIQDILNPQQVRDACQLLERVAWIDGRKTAGWHAKLVKNNRQADSASPQAGSLRANLLDQIKTNEVFRLAARPRFISPLLLSRYDKGMGYGLHVDDALMDGLRTDISFTLFLSDPDGYSGGDLTMSTTAGEQSFKLPAGSLILYPSTTLHRVEEVTKGTRLAAVGWVQSYVRDAACREILFDLDTARLSLFQREGKTTEFDLMSKSAANLLRLWAET